MICCNDVGAPTCDASSALHAKLLIKKTMARRTAALPHHSAPVQRRCWPHRGPRSGAPASRAIPLLIASNPVFSAIADIESRNYNWLLLSFGASQFFSIQCHAPLAAAFAHCKRCGHHRLAHCQRAALRQSARPSVASFTTTCTLSSAAEVLQTYSYSQYIIS